MVRIIVRVARPTKKSEKGDDSGNASLDSGSKTVSSLDRVKVQILVFIH